MWSLGVVFWEMLTLEVPFADMPPAQLIGGERTLHALLKCGFRVAGQGAASLWKAGQGAASLWNRISSCKCGFACSPARLVRTCAPAHLVLPPGAPALLPPHAPHHASTSPVALRAALGLGRLRLTIPEWCEPDWRALMESCWVEDPALRPSCRQLATHLERIRDMAR